MSRLSSLSPPRPPDTAPWLTAKELADYLSISLRSVREWTRQGKMPCHYLPGRLIRYHKDEIDTWLQGRKP